MTLRPLIMGILIIPFVASCPSPPGTQPPPRQSPQATDEKPASGSGREIRTVKLPKSMVIGDNVTLSGFYEDEPLDEEIAKKAAANEVSERPTQMPGAATPGQTQNLYRVVAPATVIVRSEQGYGTGVIYDPSGWILTNHHVVAHAKREDFRWKVTVGLGTLSKHGVMAQRKRTYKAYVHKIDPLLDMAVIKLIDPPRDLVAVRIADRDPIPGQHVTSLGHAGIGLLWAIKDGQIAGIGKLSEHLAQLQLYEAVKDKAKGTGGLFGGGLQTKNLEELKKYLAKKIPALVIQSTCDISQGDSGGPLVNDRAELVGLNAFVRSTGGSRKESNFHIHVSEVRKFLKKVPPRAPQLLPDPWTDGGSLAKLGDGDMDSVIDVLAMYKVLQLGLFSRKQAMAYFLDLDQDSFEGQKAGPAVDEVVKKRSFDAELIFLAQGSYLHAWYDTDNDGRQDVLIVADAVTQKPTVGYRIGGAGDFTKDKTLSAGKLIRPDLFGDPAIVRRLEKVGSRVFAGGLMPKTAKEQVAFPDPVQGAGHHGTLKDYSGDGKPDTVSAEGLFSSGYLFDVDQDTLGAFHIGDDLRKLRRGTKGLDAELSWISTKRQLWAWYDTDNNGTFDLLLHASRYPGHVVDRAWRAGPGGKLVQARDLVGQRMVQPELLRAPGQAGALRKIAPRVLQRSYIATGGGVRSFVEPNDYYSWGYKLKHTKRHKNVAADVRMYNCDGTLVDVDRDTARQARKAKTTILELVKQRKFDAEFAKIICRDDAWAFYDTRGRGIFDLVLYSATRGKGQPLAVYDIDKTGKVVLRDKPFKCKGLVLPALFKKAALKLAFSKMAAELFGDVADQRCRP